MAFGFGFEKTPPDDEEDDWGTAVCFRSIFYALPDLYIQFLKRDNCSY